MQGHFPQLSICQYTYSHTIKTQQGSATIKTTNEADLSQQMGLQY